DSTSLVIAIIPTKSRKSMLFILPIYITLRGYTIIIGLLISIPSNSTRILIQGSYYIIYESYHPLNKAMIILVMFKFTKNPNFYIFLNRQWLLWQLDWIIINKCHVILNL
ncbi:hypothetical protein P175DRAFT_0439477, partial [Aspergillus ochraceoroseus IBT 24754]